MLYDWKKKNLYSVSPQIAGEFLTQLENRDGQLKPSVIVAESLPSSAPLHRCFQWDDSIAGQQYREQQARNLMGNLVTIVTTTTTEEPRPISMRAFVNIPQPTSRYISMENALSSEDTYTQLKDKAWAELSSFQAKYKDIVELKPIFILIEELKNSQVEEE